MLESANIKVNAKMLEQWQDKMRLDKKFPTYNDGVLLTVALDILDEMWETVKNQESPDRFVKFYTQFQKRIEKLQKKEMLDQEVKKIRTLEEIKRAK